MNRSEEDGARRPSSWLDRLVLGSAVLALLAVALPRPAGAVSGYVLAAYLMVVPVARVAGHVWRWRRAGDRRYARVATALLLLMLAGVPLSWLLR